MVNEMTGKMYEELKIGRLRLWVDRKKMRSI